MSFPCLIQPDFSKEFFVHTDASGTALGDVLTQQDVDGNHQAIGYASRILIDVKRRYSATDSECLLVVAWAVEHLRPWLHGHKFHLFSDHSALQYLLRGATTHSTNRKQHRWIVELQGYDFTATHKASEDNFVPDALSRCHAMRVAVDTTLFGQDYHSHRRPSTVAGFILRQDGSCYPTGPIHWQPACCPSTSHNGSASFSPLDLSRFVTPFPNMWHM